MRMGSRHKQKWTTEEETALKAGVVKYGMGKWRTILSDPALCAVLHSRSNVDLKDKWRNINATANGWGSRQRPRTGSKTSPTTPRRDDDNLMTLSTISGSFEEVVDVKPTTDSRGMSMVASAKESNTRLDSLILEAITNLKEDGGSEKRAIAMYIEEQYFAPSNLDNLLVTKLKRMSENGKLIKLKRKYRIAQSSTAANVDIRHNSAPVPSERKTKKSVKMETSSAQNVEVLKSSRMGALEAAEAAARAVAAAEAAIAEAREAEREAELAEAEAEAAQLFSEAVMKALKCRIPQIWYDALSSVTS